MSKQQFKSQASICDEAIKALKEAIKTDPDNSELYQSGLDYTENIKKASEAIVKAYEVIEPAKDAERKEKDAAALAKAKEKEEAEKSAKPKGRKRKPKVEPAPVEPSPVVEPASEESDNEDVFSLFGD